MNEFTGEARGNVSVVSNTATVLNGAKSMRSTRLKDLSIRQGYLSDQAALVRLLASNDMATDVDAVDFTVAEINGILMGAARLIWIGKNDAFLRPVVVAAEARRMGIGHALLQKLLGNSANISVIARSDAVPFYEHVGFRMVDWSLMPNSYRNECEQCDDLAQCRPVSMRWTMKVPLVGE